VQKRACVLGVVVDARVLSKDVKKAPLTRPTFVGGITNPVVVKRCKIDGGCVWKKGV